MKSSEINQFFAKRKGALNVKIYAEIRSLEADRQTGKQKADKDTFDGQRRL